MDDRLIWLLKYFELHARVFQAGPMCNSAHYDAADNLGYIHVLKSGELKLQTKSRPPTTFNEPYLFFYMSPTEHRLFPQDDNVNMVCASFDFGSNLRNPLARALPDLVSLKLSDSSGLANALSLLFNEASEKHCGSDAILDRLMEIVIIQVLRELTNQNLLSTGLLAGLSDPKIMKAINAIHAEPATQWTLEDLADKAGMSRARFASKFHELVGETPGHYLAEWRIGIAQSLLRKGKPIQLISDTVGYGSASAFARAFNSHVGLTPSSWRKKLLQQTK